MIRIGVTFKDGYMQIEYFDSKEDAIKYMNTLILNNKEVSIVEYYQITIK